MRPLLLLIAAVLAVGAGFFALRLSSSPTPAPQVITQKVATVDILVAKTAIPVGTILTPDMIDRQAWPSHLVVDGFITAENTDLTGHVSRSDFSEHEPFTTTKLANPNDPSFLAAALGSNMRAVTIATDAITGIAGYVFPGDRVDVMLTHNIPAEEKSRQTKGTARTGDKPEYVEVLAPNIRVLAVNVRPNAGKEVTSAPSSITLEVDAVQAQDLRLAEKVGQLSLALRPLKGEDTDIQLKPISTIALTHASVITQAEGESVRIVRGTGAKDSQIQPVPSSGVDTDNSSPDARN